MRKWCYTTVGLLVLVAVCVLGLLWLFGTGNSRSYRDADSGPNRRHGVYGTEDSRAPLPGPPNVESPADVDGIKASFSVKWFGRVPESDIEVALTDSGGETRVSVGTLNHSELFFEVPEDGEYAFDFASAQIYCPGHGVVVKSGQPVLTHPSMHPRRRGHDREPDDALLLALGVMVDVETICETPVREASEVKMHWWGADWPGTPRAPRHALSLKVPETRRVLIPETGISFFAKSDEYWLASPFPRSFTPDETTKVLKLTFGATLPFTLELYEDTPGEYLKALNLNPGAPGLSRLGKRGIILWLAVAGEDSPLASSARHYSFGRDRESMAPVGGAVDTFKGRIPVMGEECTVRFRMRMPGDGLIAHGTTRVSPRNGEVVAQARLIGSCEISARVVDELDRPVQGVKVTASISLVQGARSMASIGPDGKGTTGEDGRVKLGPVPDDGTLRVTFFVEGLIVRAPSGHMPLQKAIDEEITITVNAADKNILRASLNRREVWSFCEYAIFEGTAPGVWTSADVGKEYSDSLVHAFRESTKYFLMVVQCGDAWFSRQGWVSGNVARSFDVDDTHPYYFSVETGGDRAFLYPYDLGAPSAWCSATSSGGFPATKIADQQTFKLRLEPDSNASWLVANDKGGVRKIPYNLRGSSEHSPLRLRGGPVSFSTVSVTLDDDKLEGATDVKLNVTPIFEDDPRYLHAQMRLGVELEKQDDGAYTAELPLGRYSVILTYTDADGAGRFGFWPGGHAEFEIRDGQVTKVHLPIR